MTTFINEPRKGEMLNRIFARMDALKLSEQMKKLFIKHNMTLADLTELKKKSNSDYELWQKMYKRNNRLMALSTYTVLER